MGIKFNIAMTGLAAAATLGATEIAIPNALGYDPLFTTLLSSSSTFEDYKPPKRLEILWFDYMKDASGSQSPNNDVTEFPTINLQYPHRAVLFGAIPTTSGYSNQSHDTDMYIIYSKVPVIDCMTFEYSSSKTGSGYITAKIDKTSASYINGDFKVVNHSWSGVISTIENVSVWAFSNYFSTIKFDFYYQCCGTLQIKGLKNITTAPYDYILTCTDPQGSGGGSTSGSSSESSSSSSSSGGDGSSSSGSGGSSSGGDGSSSGGDGSSSESEPWETDGSYPWEDDDKIPDVPWQIPDVPYDNPGEDGDGENGDTWTLPTIDIPTKPPFFGDGFNIPDFPVDITGKTPDFPVDITGKTPDFPVDITGQIPDPTLPSGKFPPPMPKPAQ